MTNSNKHKIEKEFKISMKDNDYTTLRYAVYKPEEFLSLEYQVAKIASNNTSWKSLSQQLKAQQIYEGHVAVSWDIEGLPLDWWTQSKEPSKDDVFVSLEDGWIQAKFEQNHIYLYKTTNN